MSLTITRTLGEAIAVSGPCVVHVHEIRRGSVRLRVDAPPSTLIPRAERPCYVCGTQVGSRWLGRLWDCGACRAGSCCAYHASGGLEPRCRDDAAGTDR